MDTQNKKYELLTNDTIKHNGRTLYRIKALRDITRHKVKAGDLGGYIQSEDNLSHKNDCWVGGNALVYDNALVCDNAIVSGNAIVFGNAKVCGYALVSDNAEVFGDAKVFGNACVYHYALVSGDAKVFGEAKVYGDVYVYGDAEVCGNAKVFGHAKVYGDAKVYGNAIVSGDAKVFGDVWVCGNTHLDSGIHNGEFTTDAEPEAKTKDTNEIVLAKFEIVSTNGKLELRSDQKDIDTKALLKQLLT